MILINETLRAAWNGGGMGSGFSEGFRDAPNVPNLGHWLGDAGNVFTDHPHEAQGANSWFGNFSSWKTKLGSAWSFPCFQGGIPSLLLDFGGFWGSLIVRTWFFGGMFYSSAENSS